MKKVITILIIVVFASKLMSQTTSISIGSGTGCPGDTILIPVNTTSFNNIAALTLYITYDTTKLTFNSLQNIYSSLANGISSNSVTFPVISVGIAWSSITSVNISSGKLFDLEFILKSNGCNLQISANSELVTSSLQVVNFTKVSGSILQLPTPVINQQPQNVSVVAGNPTVFSVNATGCLSYQWYTSLDEGENWEQLSNNSIYNGVNTSNLHITSNFSINNNLYKCVLSNICSIESNSANLTVTTISNVEHQSNQIQINSIYQDQNSNKLIIDIEKPVNTIYYVDIFDINGKLIYKAENSMSENQAIINIADFNEGIYLVNLTFKTNQTIVEKTIKYLSMNK